MSVQTEQGAALSDLQALWIGSCFFLTLKMAPLPRARARGRPLTKALCAWGAASATLHWVGVICPFLQGSALWVGLRWNVHMWYKCLWARMILSPSVQLYDPFFLFLFSLSLVLAFLFFLFQFFSLFFYSFCSVFDFPFPPFFPGSLFFSSVSFTQTRTHTDMIVCSFSTFYRNEYRFPTILSFWSPKQRPPLAFSGFQFPQG